MVLAFIRIWRIYSISFCNRSKCKSSLPINILSLHMEIRDQLVVKLGSDSRCIDSMRNHLWTNPMLVYTSWFLLLPAYTFIDSLPVGGPPPYLSGISPGETPYTCSHRATVILASSYQVLLWICLLYAPQCAEETVCSIC